MMKKSKFLAMMMAVTLVLAPGASAYADGTTPTTPPVEEDDNDTTPVCQEFPSDDDEDEDDDQDDSDDQDDTDEDDVPDKDDGSTDDGTTGDGTTGDDTTTTPAPQVSDRDGAKGKGNDKKENVKPDNKGTDKKDDKNGKGGKNDAKGDKEDSNDADRPDCYTHDNGKHKGWTNKIQNMVKRIDQLKQEAAGLQKQLDLLKAWALTNGSTSDIDALKQILEALAAKDEAGEADTDDLLVLAETQDQLKDTASSVQTLEKALTADYANDEVYKLLGQKLVKKGEKGIKVYVKGKKPQFDVQPVTVGGRTLVPLRAIGDALDAEVKWDEATKTITLTNKDGKVVTLQINNKQATVDGKAVTLDVPATTVNGRTLVPLRAIGDFFNLEVGWDSASNMAILK